jgi:hypothetical protein
VRTGFIPGNKNIIKISSSSFVMVGFEKPAEGQICVPETPSQNPAGKGENRQSIKNEENHKFLFVSARRTTSGRKRRGSPTTKRVT